MRRKSFLCLVGLTIASLLIVSAGAATLNKGKLKIGSDLTEAPYDYMEANVAAGFDPELMRVLAVEMKLEPEFVDTRFADLITGVNAQRFDVIASALYVTPERAKQLDFIPYFTTGAVMLVRSDSDWKPTKPEQLCGKRVASDKGASWIPRLAQVSKEICAPSGRSPIDVREFPTSPEASQAVLARSAEVQIEDAAISKFTAERSKGRLVLTSSEPLYPVVVGLGIRKGNTELVKAMEQAFATIKGDGRYAKLLATYNLTEPTAAQVSAALGNGKTAPK
ncbi:transporter substrate-binding domain-containing protein [Burkholderia sp. MR1-5-21]